jgi:hypothetical protein
MARIALHRAARGRASARRLICPLALGTAGGRTRYAASGRRNAPANTSEEEKEMRKLMLIGVALAVGAFGLDQTLAQQVQQQGEEQAGEEAMKVTGMVTEADQQTKEITIEDETFVMPDAAGGASVFPQVGAEVTVFYREEDGQKVITRIGQAEE